LGGGIAILAASIQGVYSAVFFVADMHFLISIRLLQKFSKALKSGAGVEGETWGVAVVRR
jgi:hypothetical protein